MDPSVQNDVPDATERGDLSLSWRVLGLGGKTGPLRELGVPVGKKSWTNTVGILCKLKWPVTEPPPAHDEFDCRQPTTTNPNRLFFGCPFFKLKNPSHCKFFLWLDDHLSTIRVLEKFTTDNEVDDLKVYLGKKVVEQKVIDLEKKVLYLERKKNVNLYLVIVAVVCVIFASVIVNLG
ncbi:uncharacterized protein DS421_13g424880 [Arachis hypogaea]|nr:uncharacterized protein DS421_13g424880 [Arachis hypogaea]